MNITVLATDLGFTEGPVTRPTGEVIVTSIDRGQIYQLSAGTPALLASVGGGPNGATDGLDGRVYVAQNGGASPAVRSPGITGGVQVIGHGGEVAWVTRDPVSPNDLCFGPDGLLYITDPTRNGRRDDGRIWRCDPGTGEAELLASVGWYPNGIGFGEEDDSIYVASSGEGTIKRFPLTGSGVGRPETVFAIHDGLPDGFAFDVEGNIVVAAPREDGQPGSIQTWTIDGRQLDEFRPGTEPYYTNVALTPDARLVITASSAGAVLLIDDWPNAGLALHPFRTSSAAQ